MAFKQRYVLKVPSPVSAIPFDNAEEAWFWFIQCQEAKGQGLNGQGMWQRPCEPVDILKVLDRLYRMRRLHRDHLLVLRHYDRRLMAPDPRRVKEVRAHDVWCEALERITPPLMDKGIIRHGVAALFRPLLATTEILTMGAHAQ